jgi:hypothetical protein
MTAAEAVAYGIVDQVLENKKDFTPPPSEKSEVPPASI